MNGRGHGSTGFTLVELMAVIFVIAALVGVVVGVSLWVTSVPAKEETKVRLQTIMNAVIAYQEYYGDYPDEGGSIGGASGWLTRDRQAYVRCQRLVQRLKLVPAAADKLKGLGKGWKTIEGADVLVDGFGKYIDYRRSLGAGGQPMLESAGPDANFESQGDNIVNGRRKLP